jgi:hypothetical protein
MRRSPPAIKNKNKRLFLFEKTRDLAIWRPGRRVELR